MRCYVLSSSRGSLRIQKTRCHCYDSYIILYDLKKIKMGKELTLKHNGYKENLLSVCHKAGRLVGSCFGII